MLYLLILFVLLLCYRFFLFKHLGKWRFTITFVLFALSAVAMGICWWQELYIAFFMGLLLCIFMVGTFLNDIEGWNQLRRRNKLATLPARKLKSSTMDFPLSHEDMLTNFRELAAEDELACYTPAKRFLSWNDGAGHIIQIHLLPDTESWVGIFYAPDASELRDSEITAACRKANIPCSKALLGMAPQGIAICQQGQITITPASQRKHFAPFLATVLAPRPDFTAWLAEYTEDE